MKGNEITCGSKTKGGAGLASHCLLLGREEVFWKVAEGRVVYSRYESALFGVMETQISSVDSLLDVVFNDQICRCCAATHGAKRNARCHFKFDH